MARVLILQQHEHMYSVVVSKIGRKNIFVFGGDASVDSRGFEKELRHWVILPED
jgi:hypothetical protein